MALIDKEQICAEIKAQKNAAEGSYVPGDDNNYWYGKVVLCDELLAFLDTLPEQPVDGLEEAAEVYRRNSCNATLKPNVDGTTPEYSGSIKDAFIAGAEWQKKLDDLETADLLAIAHLQGMEQQKAKMMEEAVEGEIQMRYSGCLCAKTIRAINEDKFKLGDKVKIIVIKED